MKALIIVVFFIIFIAVLPAQSLEPEYDIVNMQSMISVDSLYAHVQHLQDYQTRYSLADNHQEIATWVFDQFESYGFTNTWMQEYPLQGTTQYNVIATIQGYMYPDIYIIVGAHYDSQSTNSSNYVLAPGADDNASGTAGMLEMARVMKTSGYQPRCSIRFIGFSAEEGLGWGSTAYCDYAISENHDIRLMVCFDMIASNYPVSTEFIVGPYPGSEEFCVESIRISEQYCALQPVMGTINIGSDSYIFSINDFDAVLFIERYLSPYYHTSQDIIDHLDFEYASQIVQAALATTAVFANQPRAVDAVNVHDTGTGNSLLAVWDSVPDPSITHFKVYYGNQMDSMIFWQNVSENYCLIEGLEEGQDYYVAITSVNDDGYESVRVYNHHSPLSIPRPPQSLSDLPNTSSITIAWEPNKELDIESYGVYRSLGPNGSVEYIGIVAAPDHSYTDATVQSNEEYYYYRTCAIDSDGNQSQFSEAVTSRMVSLDRGILIIDETRNPGGASPFQPSDQLSDEYYSELFQRFVPVHDLDLDEYSGTLRLADLGIYSSIMWHGNDNTDVVYPYGLRDVLRQYIYMGGKVFFSLYFPSKAFELNAGYPASFPPDSYMNEVLGIAGVDYRVGARFKYAVPDQEDYPMLQVDSLKTVTSWQGHIFGVEGFEPVSLDHNVFVYGSDYGSDSIPGALNGMSVGIHHYYGAGQVFCTSFPLYNMQYSFSEALVYKVFYELFNETVGNQEHHSTAVSGLSLLPNFPNPFNPHTAIVYDVPSAQRVRVGIYNLKGQFVRTMVDADIKRGRHEIVWNGEDYRGSRVPSGIYFVRMEGKTGNSVRKIMLIK